VRLSEISTLSEANGERSLPLENRSTSPKL
jgi:hypothetical protein